MKKEVFQKQILRLQQTYGENNYASPRVELFWKTFQFHADADFEEAVDLLIGNSRKPPMFEDLEKAIADARARNAERARRQADSNASFSSVLKSAAAKANTEFSRECVKLLDKCLNGQITKKQFEQGCDWLDQASRIGGADYHDNRNRNEGT